MKLLNQRQHRQTQRLYAILAVALVAAVFTAVLYRKNRQLRHRNRQLYQKNVEQLSTISAERRRREESLKAQRHYEAEIESLKSQLGHTTDDEQKYKNSSLDETAKDDLATRVLYTLEHSEEIYSPDFTLEQLAQLVGSNYKHVSQVINEKLNKNYNRLLNEYRIYKACGCLNDQEHFGHLTIEAIARSVGFRSRTSFASAFKRVTGLTPSEYLSMAKTRE